MEEQADVYQQTQAAAKLTDVPVGESPAGGGYPVDTVVIPGDEKGDQLVGSPEVKVSSMEASNLAGRSASERVGSPEMLVFESVEPFLSGRRPASSVKGLGECSRRTLRGL
jgi:hypothetical protein